MPHPKLLDQARLDRYLAAARRRKDIRSAFEEVLPSVCNLAPRAVGAWQSHISEYWSPTFWHDLRELGVRLPSQPSKNLIETLYKVARQSASLKVFACNIRMRFLGGSGSYFVNALKNLIPRPDLEAQAQASKLELTKQYLSDYFDAVDSRACPEPCASEADNWAATSAEEDDSSEEEILTSTRTDLVTPNQYLPGEETAEEQGSAQVSNFEDEEPIITENLQHDKQTRPAKRVRSASPELARRRQLSLPYSTPIRTHLESVRPSPLSSSSSADNLIFTHDNDESVVTAMTGTPSVNVQPVTDRVQKLRHGEWSSSLAAVRDVVEAADATSVSLTAAKAELSRCQRTYKDVQIRVQHVLYLDGFASKYLLSGMMRPVQTRLKWLEDDRDKQEQYQQFRMTSEAQPDDLEFALPAIDSDPLIARVAEVK
ncbi:hypothetical protein EK21DRAFT_118442 [Setomelanomma holmii]|uniref:Uncharacterized protein n=1 Tax=Setomelanomma holmii TaxID=210430 RepID=A0A9P4GXH4_9PLEO|nr:hypothetical protein EK21DRAFT_118442 [Setomelanomma holmii]